MDSGVMKKKTKKQLHFPKKLTIDLLEDGVGIQIHTHHVHRGVVKVKVAGVDSHDEGHRCQQHISHLQWTQRDVRTKPAQRETHLETPKRTKTQRSG